MPAGATGGRSRGLGVTWRDNGPTLTSSGVAHRRCSGAASPYRLGLCSRGAGQSRRLSSRAISLRQWLRLYAEAHRRCFPFTAAARGLLSVQDRPQRPACRSGSRRQHRHLSRQAAHRRERWRRSHHDRRARDARRGQPRAQGRPSQADRLRCRSERPGRRRQCGELDAHERELRIAFLAEFRRRRLQAVSRRARLPSDAQRV